MNLAAKLISQLCLWGALVGIAIGCIFYFLLPAFYSVCYPVILLSMLVLESLLIGLVEKSSRKVSDIRLVHIYMAVTGGKMLLAIMVITLYALSSGVAVKAFAISFISVYLLFLVLESMSFVKLEKHLKEKRLKS